MIGRSAEVPRGEAMRKRGQRRAIVATTSHLPRRRSIMSLGLLAEQALHELAGLFHV